MATGRVPDCVGTPRPRLPAAVDKPAATALLAYLKGDKARAIIKSYGYESR